MREAKRIVQDRDHRLHTIHKAECHDPKDPQCPDCIDSMMTRDPSTAKQPTDEPVSERGLKISLDFMGPFEQSVDGNVYLFGGIEQSGFASVQPLPDKTGPVTAEGLLEIVREVRIAADPAVQLQVHIHSDKDKSIIEGAVQ